MRVVFLVLGNSRRSNYLNGDTIRTGGGGASGTDGSNILVAEYLAANGFDVTICTERLEPKLEEKYSSEGKNPPNGTQIRGVYYTDFDFTGIDNRTYDIVVSNLWFDKYDDLPITVTRGLLYWVTYCGNVYVVIYVFMETFNMVTGHFLFPFRDINYS